MKKILIVFMTILLVFNTAFALATPEFKYKEVYTPQELISWIQNENKKTFQRGRYKVFLESIRKKGVVLIADGDIKNQFYRITISDNGGISYWRGGKYPNRTRIKISEVNEEKRHLLEISILDYFKNDEQIYKDKVYEIIKENGEKIQYVKYNEKDSSQTGICFVKGDFTVTIWSDCGESLHFLESLSFELVSLDKPAELPYTDIQESDWFYEDVGRSIYIPSTTETTFSPNIPADRVTIASALYNTKGELSYTMTPDFVDIDEDNPYATAICWAQQCGIVNGVGDNKFNPTGNVTRQDFAVMLWRYMKYCKFELPPIEDAKVFADDGEIADYAREAVKTLNVLGIMNGKGNDIIDPRGNVTRAESAAMLHRMMNKMK